MDISGCGKLLAIDSGAFSGCIDLQRVTISLNRYLSHISTGAFDKSMTQLKILNLADNRLGGVSESLVPWRKLEYLELSGNPWHCDCKLYFISAVLSHLRNQNQNVTDKSKNKVVAIAGKCATPSRLSGTSLHDFLHFKGCERRSQLLEDQDNEVMQVVSDSKQRFQREKNFDVQNTAAHEIVKNEYDSMDEEELMRANNATAVIASVCVVVVVLVLAIVLFAVFRCRYRRNHFGSSP